VTHRRRGAPATKFDETARQKYLDAVAAGTPLGEAAALVNVTPTWTSSYAHNDPAFAQALADAKARGKAARDDKKDHGEYRYNVLGCRCDICTAAATTARRGRRHTAHDQAETPPPPVATLTTATGSSPTSLPLRSSSSVENHRAA
jgi:hypothetical protein